ncbi:MAG: excinuclease ABC subunit UvrA [Euryarchaeota archaeon]|nr:excinuclease ABC subunit UvrA [Euryarchaeota archaeon]
MGSDAIYVRGAREHNLKGIDVVIPREKLVVITGLSGSGKSSLAFDTLYAEGQRRYVESLSSYARQFLGQMKKPDVEHIDGLSPAISIDQKTVHRNPRSTVGTVTEVYDYLRLLFAHVGTPHCPSCDAPVQRQSPEEIVERILALPEGSKLQILAPVVRGRKGTYKKLFKELLQKGYVRARVNGAVHDLNDDIELGRYEKHDIEAVVDRVVVKADQRSRIQDSVEQALEEGEGVVIVNVAAVAGTNGAGKKTTKGKKGKSKKALSAPEVDGQDLLFSEHFACPNCNVSLPEIVPRIFSFNSPQGACDPCSGLGFSIQVDPAKIITDPSKPLTRGAFHKDVFRTNQWIFKWLRALGDHYGVDISVPWSELPADFQDVVLYGTGEEIDVTFRGGKGKKSYRFGGTWEFEGICTRMDRLYHETESERLKKRVEQFHTETPCKACKADRLRPEVLAVRIRGKNIIDTTRMPIDRCLAWFEETEQRFTEHERKIGHEVIKEIKARLGFMINVGLGYLDLARASGTLSGGEAQRIRLASQIGSGLVGVLYILDEPSIGLHQRDNIRLIHTLQHLRDSGNTVLVVEHDEETMWAADHVIDLGPGAGEHGGRVVAEGTPKEVAADPESVTGAYLSGRRSIAIPTTRRSGNGKELVVKGARQNNLKKIDVRFPLGRFICVTGVSGSGKSTLVNDVLVKGAIKSLNGHGDAPGAHDSIEGLKHVDKLIVIDQSPIGRTPRSNPATYTGVFTPIRELFAQTPESKKRGYKPGRFSFNVKGGRCESCAGDGMVKIEMHFLPDVYVPCEVCKGSRYNKETLVVKYKGKTIRDVLDMTVEEALVFFDAIPAIRNKMQTLYDVGLTYIRLGQPATTLSGGEAQRVKLATELAKRSTGKTLYVLDEPTTGLHFHDITHLLGVLERLTEQGNTVIVIEHNMDVVKTADHIIDLGPEGGEGGGKVVATGTPEEVAKTKTWTGRYLAKVLKNNSLVEASVRSGKKRLVTTATV